MHTWELLSATPGSLAPTIEASITNPYDSFATAAEAPTMRDRSRLYFDGQDFQLDAISEYWNGAQFIASNKSVDFSAGTEGDYLEGWTGNDVVDSDLPWFNLRAIGRAVEKVWPNGPDIAPHRGHGVVQGRHFACRVHISAQGSAFTFFEGDLQDPDGNVNSVECQDVDEFLGAAQKPIACLRR